MKKYIILTAIIIVLLLFAGNTHRFLPASVDNCQTDITHANHIVELPMYHCIGHTEYVADTIKEGLFRVAKWDHIHSWMTLEWHLKQGFPKEKALKLLSQSSE